MSPASTPIAIDGIEAPPLGTVHAAGAVVWRERDGRLEVCLVHRPRYRDWSWPKGKLDAGESVPGAAVREVAEEIGEQVALGVPLPALHYRMPDGRRKHVRYWAATLAPDDAPALAARPEIRPAELTEIDDVVWVSAPTAQDMLTRRADRTPLAAVQDMYDRGRLATHALVVARHGRAVPRQRWHGDEASRPLTPPGREQAESLVAVLAAFAVRDVHTSPWDRCVQTLQPYVQAAPVAVHHVEALTESAHAADPATVVEVVQALLTGTRGTVISTHRPVLPTVLATIGSAMRSWSLGRLPAKDPWLRPGEVVVAHVSGGVQDGREPRVVAVENHRPPRSV